MQTKVKDKKIRMPTAKGSKSVSLSAFEKELALETFVDIRLKGRQVGCGCYRKAAKVSGLSLGLSAWAFMTISKIHR